MSITSLLFGRPLNRLEDMLLAALEQAFPPELREIFRRQVKSIGSVKRMAGGREVLCYRRKGERRGPSVSAFPTIQAELKFARIAFSNSLLGTSWNAEFYLVKGYFFSIVFTPAPHHLGKIHDLQIDKVEITADVSRVIPEPSVQTTVVPLQSVQLPAWIERLASEGKEVKVYRPLPHSARGELVKQLSSVLPEDYLSLLLVTEGASIGDLSILGLSQVFEVVMQDWNYFVVAELRSSGVVAVKAHGRDGELFLLDYEGAEPRSLGGSLAVACSRLMAEMRQRGTS